MRISNLLPLGKKDTTTYHDPFEVLRQEIDSLFDRSYGNFSLVSNNRKLELDVVDKGDEFQVKADVPGLSEEDLSINLNNGYLTINGEKKVEKKEDKDNYYLMERSYGSFTRSLQLPFTANPDEIKAKLKDGVLTITIKKPKEALESTKKIKIESK